MHTLSSNTANISFMVSLHHFQCTSSLKTLPGHFSIVAEEQMDPALTSCEYHFILNANAVSDHCFRASGAMFMLDNANSVMDSDNSTLLKCR